MANYDFEFFLPTRIISGVNSRQKLGRELEKLQAKSVLLVTDRTLVEAGVVAKVEDVLRQSGVNYHVYDKVIPNPLDSTVDEGCTMAKEVLADVIIGVGGGSSLDTATGIAMLAANGGKCIEYFKGKPVVKASIPYILLPTTAGTGSEVNRCFVVTDPTNKFKDGIAEDSMCPTISILDPELSVSMPAHITAATGVDAFTHALEAYQCRNAHPLSDALNIHAMKMIAGNLRKAVTDPTDMVARSNMMLASAIAGVGFDQVGLVLAHAMAHPLSGLFNIPHGVACGVVTPPVIEFNVVAIPEKFVEVAKILGEPVGYGSLVDQGRAAATAFRKLLSDIGMPLTISELDVTSDDIPKLTEDAFAAKGMRGRNPRVNDKRDIARLYESLL